MLQGFSPWKSITVVSREHERVMLEEQGDSKSSSGGGFENSVIGDGEVTETLRVTLMETLTIGNF